MTSVTKHSRWKIFFYNVVSELSGGVRKQAIEGENEARVIVKLGALIEQIFWLSFQNQIIPKSKLCYFLCTDIFSSLISYVASLCWP